MMKEIEAFEAFLDAKMEDFNGEWWRRRVEGRESVL